MTYHNPGNFSNGSSKQINSIPGENMYYVIPISAVFAVATLICIFECICFIRRKRQQKPVVHIQGSNTQEPTIGSVVRRPRRSSLSDQLTSAVQRLSEIWRSSHVSDEFAEVEERRDDIVNFVGQMQPSDPFLGNRGANYSQARISEITVLNQPILFTEDAAFRDSGVCSAPTDMFPAVPSKGYSEEESEYVDFSADRRQMSGDFESLDEVYDSVDTTAEHE